MDIRSWWGQASEYGSSFWAQGVNAAGSGFGYLSGLVGNLRVIGSSIADKSNTQGDERHYFLVPDPTAADGYSLVIARSLPEGVPPINDLPKHRLLHLPNIEAETMLRTILVQQAQSEELQKDSPSKSLSNRTNELANSIDALDDRIFQGIFLIGGLVAIFNPLLGAAVVAKAMIPSLGMLASKYGLRLAGEKLEERELQQRAYQAKQDVLKQFKNSSVRVEVSKVLEILDRALRTSEDEFDPLLAMHEHLQKEQSDEVRRWERLSAQAVLNVFDEASNNTKKLHQWDIEDKRFLELLRTITAPSVK